MVPDSIFRSAVERLKPYAEHTTKVTWVNWRQGFQIKMHWWGNASFQCFLDFGKNSNGRDAVLQRAFERHASPGTKPYIEQGHGWSKARHDFQSDEFISINVLHDLANEMNVPCTVLYVQDCASSRPVFDDLGIGLVPGEMGKEWKDGAFISYACPQGMNL